MTVTPPLALAVAQSSPAARDVGRNVEDHARLAVLAATHDARLVLFPELSLTGYDRELTPAEALSPSDGRLWPLRE
jgi:predicted amidohydrolase